MRVAGSGMSRTDAPDATDANGLARMGREPAGSL